MNHFSSELQAWYLRERDILNELNDEVPQDIQERYLIARQDLLAEMLVTNSDEGRDDVMDREDSLRTWYERLIERRLDKLHNKAMVEAMTGQPADISGALPGEKATYQGMLVIYRAAFAGVKG